MFRRPHLVHAGHVPLAGRPWGLLSFDFSGGPCVDRLANLLQGGRSSRQILVFHSCRVSKSALFPAMNPSVLHLSTSSGEASSTVTHGFYTGISSGFVPMRENSAITSLRRTLLVPAQAFAPPNFSPDVPGRPRLASKEPIVGPNTPVLALAARLDLPSENA